MLLESVLKCQFFEYAFLVYFFCFYCTFIVLYCVYSVLLPYGVINDDTSARGRDTGKNSGLLA